MLLSMNKKKRIKKPLQKTAAFCHNIGTLLLFRRKSIYAILKMLKSIQKLNLVASRRL